MAENVTGSDTILAWCVAEAMTTEMGTYFPSANKLYFIKDAKLFLFSAEWGEIHIVKPKSATEMRAAYIHATLRGASIKRSVVPVGAIHRGCSLICWLDPRKTDRLPTPGMPQ